MKVIDPTIEHKYAKYRWRLFPSIHASLPDNPDDLSIPPIRASDMSDTGADVRHSVISLPVGVPVLVCYVADEGCFRRMRIAHIWRGSRLAFHSPNGLIWTKDARLSNFRPLPEMLQPVKGNYIGATALDYRYYNTLRRASHIWLYAVVTTSIRRPLTGLEGFRNQLRDESLACVYGAICAVPEQEGTRYYTTTRDTWLWHYMTLLSLPLLDGPWTYIQLYSCTDMAAAPAPASFLSWRKSWRKTLKQGSFKKTRIMNPLPMYGSAVLPLGGSYVILHGENPIIRILET